MTRVPLSLFVSLSLLTIPAGPVAAAQGVATLIAPHGNVVGTTMAFSWRAVPEATAYLLTITGVLTSYGTRMEVWYTAAQAGCAGIKLALPGTCTIVLTPPVVAGPYRWFVQTWGSGGFGPVSEPLIIVVKDPVQSWGSRAPLPAVRFSNALSSVTGVAWVDNETGLVWAAPEGEITNGNSAQFICHDKIVNNRMGFRLPTRDELLTLVDRGESNPSLPEGNPFGLGPAVAFSDLKFWTQSTVFVASTNTTFTWVGDFVTGGAFTVKQAQLATQKFGVWCVRGPGGRAQ